jgi:hypothetical protein
MWHRSRSSIFLIALTGFIALSAHRFSEFAFTEHKLDAVSQADLIGTPARQYLTARLGHAAHIGCLSSNPQWPDACDYLWYSMLPFYVDPTHPGAEPVGYPYFLFISDPQSLESAEVQASRIRNYRVNMPLVQGALLLERSNE